MNPFVREAAVAVGVIHLAFFALVGLLSLRTSRTEPTPTSADSPIVAELVAEIEAREAELDALVLQIDALKADHAEAIALLKEVGR